MRHSRYLIIGGGMAADSAMRGIRKIDQTGDITLVGEEADPPYDRPPLSKSLWKEKRLETIWRNASGLKAEVVLGRKVVTLDAANKIATDDTGVQYGYDKLLLATGGAVRRLPDADESVIYLRTADDYRRLRALTERGSDFAVIGGGFIGSEIAAALAMNHKHVMMIFPGHAIGDNVYPQALAVHLNTFFRDKGVTLLTSETVKSVRASDSKIIVTTGNGAAIHADGVVAGLGIIPNTALAEQAGLRVDNGIVVDELLRSSNPDIYAAGDVANFYSTVLDRHMRVEHEDAANTMGERAGMNMAGQTERYVHQPFFYSDLFELGYEAVGELNASMDIVEDWLEPFQKGVIYYLRDGVVRGVLLWNTWGQVEAATQLIAARQPQSGASLRGRIRD